MSKFEKLCVLCGVSPESDEAKAIMAAVNEMLYGDVYYTNDEILASVGNRFRKPNVTTVYDFILVFEDGDSQYRYVVASSEEEATEKLEAYYRDLEKQGFQYPSFISNPAIHVDYVIT